MAWIIRQFRCEDCNWEKDALFKTPEESEVIHCSKCAKLLQPVPATASLDKSALANWRK